MSYTTDGVCIDPLSILIYGAAIVVTRPVSISKTERDASDAARALSLIKIQDIATLNDIAIEWRVLNRKIGDLCSAAGTVYGKGVQSVALQGEGYTIARMSSNGDHNITGFGARGNGNGDGT